MKRSLLLAVLALSLSACAPVIVKTAPVSTPIPGPIVNNPCAFCDSLPAPKAKPDSAPAGPVTVYDASLLTVAVVDSTVTVALTPGAHDTWMQVRLPDGSVSEVTTSPAGPCLGFGAGGLHQLNVSTLAGLSAWTAPTCAGPWTEAAKVN